MKRVILAAVAAGALAIPATASADRPTDKCSSATHGATWKTPGAMFQAARAGYGVNPKELAGLHGVSVGEFVAVACRNS